MSSQSTHRTQIDNTPANWANEGIKNATAQLNEVLKRKKYQPVPVQRQANLSHQTQNTIDDINNNINRIYHQESAAEQHLSDMAKGKYLKEGNPYYRERLHNDIDKINNIVQSQFSGAGRYGSTAHVDALSRNSQDMLLAGLEKDYNRALDNMVNANNQIDQNKRVKDQTLIASLKDKLLSGQLVDKHNQEKNDINYKNELRQRNREFEDLKSYADIMNILNSKYGKISKDEIIEKSIWEKILADLAVAAVKSI
ncbi:hypothetical protein [Bartonella sp. DGB1]|uniref:hypothetical protein n=1 Tax=Bartonella sp. DGB1 TaxID=3239807 RepID=UPI0035260A8E